MLETFENWKKFCILLPTSNKGGVSHRGLAIYIIKKHLKAHEELWKLKYFTMQI
jgi:hypothetical protein